MLNLPDSVRIWVGSPIAIFAAFAPLLLSQILQIASLLVLPFSRPLFRKINTTIAGAVWDYWSWAIQTLTGVKMEISGDPLPRGEDAIVIANHQGMGDIPVLVCLANRGGATQRLKWLVKDILKYVPGIGWGLLFLDSVFLKRDWARDEATIRRVFSRIADNHLPVWLASFPEGTRATPAKLAASRAQPPADGKIAPLQYLLRPRHKGFNASIVGLRRHVKAVYSVTIGYHGKPPTLLGLMRGDVPKVSIHVRRFRIDELPKGQEQLAQWLNEEYRIKDKLLAEFFAHAHWGEG